jgi:hypothetical protein
MSNKKFWIEQAKNKGINSVNFDENMHELENAAILVCLPMSQLHMNQVQKR